MSFQYIYNVKCQPIAIQSQKNTFERLCKERQYHVHLYTSPVTKLLHTCLVKCLCVDVILAGSVQRLIGSFPINPSHDKVIIAATFVQFPHIFITWHDSPPMIPGRGRTPVVEIGLHSVPSERARHHFEFV